MVEIRYKWEVSRHYSNDPALEVAKVWT